jgi:hypothetical protein
MKTLFLAVGLALVGGRTFGQAQPAVASEVAAE